MENNHKDNMPEKPTSNGTGSSSTIQNSLKARYTNMKNLLRAGAGKIAGATCLWIFGYFNFSWLWIVIGVGVLLYVAENSKKRKASAMIAKRVNDNPEELVQAITEVYKMSGKELPSWIYYPDVEKAEWLNTIIQKLWPFIGDFVGDLLKNQIQTSIRESSSLLSEFSFTDVELGQRAPRVAGVKVHDEAHTKRDEIVIDVQIIYEGDCDIGVAVSFLEAGIKDVRLRGLLRIELKPLVGEIPLVGAVSVAFVKDPVIDFDLTELANFLDLPGFSGLLRGAIADCIGAMLVLPERYIVKLSPNIDISRLRFPMPKGLIRIHVIDAENLAEKDKKIFGLGGKSDPFVVVKVGHQNKFTTKTIESSLNPKWNESFDALIRDVEYGNIEFDVYDDDGALSKADFLGRITISVKNAFKRGVINEKIKLLDTDTGRLHVSLEWFDLSSNQKDLDQAIEHSSKGTLNCALLNIYVVGAKDLPNRPDEPYDPSPYLKITDSSGNVFKTKTFSNSNQPVWEENFRILIKQPLHENIKFQLEDECNDADSLGNLAYSVKNLLSAPDMMLDQPLALQNSTSKAVLITRMSLRLLKLKQPSSENDSDENVFTVAGRDRSSHEDKDGNAAASSPADASTSTLSVSSADTSSTHHPDGSSSHDHSVNDESDVGADAVDNLRVRLNAKKNDNNNAGGPEVDAGLGRIQLTLRYLSNSLVVVVLRAENLIICDEDDQTSDPYVRISFMPPKNKRKKTKVTKVVKKNLNPTFDQKLEFSVSSKDEVSEGKLKVTVKNQTGFLSSEKTFMGEVLIDLAQVDVSQPVTEWYSLQIPEEI